MKRNPTSKRFASRRSVLISLILLLVIMLFGHCSDHASIGKDTVYVENPGEGNDIGPYLKLAWQKARAGDQILLPQGSFKIDGTVVLNGSDAPDVHLKGAGSGINGTKLYRDYETHDFMIIIRGGATRVEISDIYFEGIKTRLQPGGKGSTYSELRCISLMHIDFYVHHCKFQYFTDYILTIRKDQFSDCVVSDNEFVDNMVLTENGDWDGGSCVVVTGKRGEWVDVVPGSGNFVFIEDNYFSAQSSPATGGEGGLYVFRYNYVERNNYYGSLNMHGSQPSWRYEEPYYSSRFIEVYENTFICAPEDDPLYRANNRGILNSFGGQGVIWNNTIDGYYVGMTLTLTNAWWDDDAPGRPKGWETPDYPIFCQAGWESGQRYGSGHTGTNPSTYGAGDFYIWNNDYVNMKGARQVDTPTNSYSATRDYILEGRDYHRNKLPGYTPFTYPHPIRTRTMPSFP